MLLVVPVISMILTYGDHGGGGVEQAGGSLKGRVHLQTSGEGPAAHCAAQLGRVRTGRSAGPSTHWKGTWSS